MNRNPPLPHTQPDSGASKDDTVKTAKPGELRVDNVSYAYLGKDTKTQVLENVSFRVSSGEVACVVGPSGCGKSTLLNLVAGLQTPVSGSLWWDGKPLTSGTNHDMAMAFQQPGLFPWMTVRRNVSIGLRTRGHTKAEAAKRTDAVLNMVGLAEFEESYPSQLSGGMAQRVGIARALVLKPRLLLLDEPFAAVDAFTRLTLQEEFKSLLTLDRPTVMFVTHDVSEAIMLGDYVVVMTNRPATVKAEFSITSGTRDRATPEYSEMLANILGKLGIKDGKSR